MSIEEKDYERMRERMAAYNRPPETPREEMWPAIQAAWKQQAAEHHRLRRQKTWFRFVTAAAAVLVMGLAIGRWSTAPTVGPTAVEMAGAGRGASEELPLAYRLAAADHFMQAEMLFLLFKTDPQDYDVAGLAQDLLMTTRLLLDSRIGQDPQMRELLMDIELLAVQMAQLEGENHLGERQLIREGMEGRSVLPRLRRFIPAGPTAAGA